MTTPNTIKPKNTNVPVSFHVCTSLSLNARTLPFVGAVGGVVGEPVGLTDGAALG